KATRGLCSASAAMGRNHRGYTGGNGTLTRSTGGGAVTGLAGVSTGATVDPTIARFTTLDPGEGDEDDERDRGRNRAWSASAASSAVWNRPCGLGSMSRARIWTRPEGRSGRRSVIGTGWPLRRSPRRSIGVWPGKGSWPVIRWYIAQPRLNRS